MERQAEIESFAREIIDTVSAYRTAQIYITFAELDIGEALEPGALSVPELAHRTGTAESALKRFLNAAAAFELVRWRDDGRVELTEMAREAFTPNGHRPIANLLKLEGSFYDRWGRLPEAVRLGTRPPENRAQEDHPEWVRQFTLALYDRARQVAPAIAEAIDIVLPAPERRSLRLIDVGGGHGAYSIALAERRPDIEAVVFDLPKVIETTREIVAQSAVSNRVRAIAGDFHRDPLGDDFDVILLFGVLHGETTENARQLIQTLHNALTPGGVLLIRSHGRRVGSSETGERELTDLHMLLSTEGGQARGSIDTVSLVTEHGFHAEQPVDIPAPGAGTLLVFRRQA